MKNQVPFRTLLKFILAAVGIYLLPLISKSQGTNLCTNPTSLTSDTICNPANGSLALSNYTAFTGAVTTNNDVWFQFVAQTTNPTITATGSTATNLRIQLVTANCAAPGLVQSALTNTMVTTGLTVGTSYYIRIYSNTNSGGLFTICVVDPPQAADVCTNAALLLSSTTCQPILGTLTGSTNTAFTGECPSVTRNDVWFRFVAKTTNPTITVVQGIGASDLRVQLATGTCGAIASVSCSTLPTLAATGLTVGTTYFIRVYSNANSGGRFTICVTDPAPVNDNCVNATELLSQLTCTNTAGNLYASTGAATPSCTIGTVAYDVWYTFIASAARHTITLSSLGSDIAGARLQLLSGTCGSLTSISCGTGSLAPTTLVPGTRYFVRVYVMAPTTTITTNTNAGFNICITNPLSNDECSGAITLAVKAGCEKVWGTAINATVSTPAQPTCSGNTGVDVWYKFTATATSISLGFADIGAGISGASVQVLQGTCGSAMTQVLCATGNTTVTGLTINSTYFIRVVTGSTTAPAANGGYSICLSATTAIPGYGVSYVNISRPGGGVVQQNDILEIRTSIAYGATSTFYYPRWLDNVPTNTTMLTGPTDYIRVLTNEGVAWQQWTTASGDDPAMYIATPPASDYNLKANLRFANGTAPVAAGSPTNTNPTSVTGCTGNFQGWDYKPEGNGILTFSMSFRVRVTGTPGSIITLGPGMIRYKLTNSAGAADQVIQTLTPYTILISDPSANCANSTGINQAGEFGGTFGHGTTLNRPADLTFPIPGYTLVTASSIQSIGDGQYAIVKSTSPLSGVSATNRFYDNCAGAPVGSECANRMFGGYWDIAGDHSGNTTSAGNLPPAAATDGGYMLIVNSDNIPSTIYQQTINNLCPNTYYEFSAYVKNICSVCGVTPTGLGGPNSGFPGQTNLPGVNPNLTFSMNGVDRYSTGEVTWSAQTGGWEKRGFVFNSGATGTFNFAIRTNSNGGGGNDWAIDDIAVTTCLPTLSYTPSLNPDVCENQVFNISNLVRSIYNNYGNWKWQRSTDDGLTFSDIGVTTPYTGSSTPTLVAGQYEYPLNYVIPAASSTPANNGDIYRVVVATTGGNLSNANCQVTDGITQVQINVVTCGPVLKTELLSFAGKLNTESKANLSWTTSLEDGQITYNIERADDGVNFIKVGSILGYNNGNAKNTYSFVDFTPVNGKASYRITLVAANSKQKRSSVVTLSRAASGYDFGTVVNPFISSLRFEIVINEAASLDVELIDATGKTVRKEKINAYSGVNSLSLNNTDRLNSGVYTLRVLNKDKILTKRVLKSY